MKLLSFLFVVLSFSDLVTTLHLMDICGSNIEGNPLAAFLYNNTGWIGMAVLKAITVVVVVGITWYIRFQGKTFYPYFILLIGCLIHLYTVVYTLLLVSQ